MSTVSQTTGNVAASEYAAQSSAVKNDSKVKKADYGKTIGTPELSEKAQKYYEQLKKKYSNMDFILVSEDQKAQAQAQAGRYANANRMVVLIDEEKVERMASDENYRRQYEGIISGATSKLAQIKTSLGSNSSKVKTYGMQVKDGMASFFAVLKKSQVAQKKRLEKNAARRAKEKEQAKEAAEEKRAEKKKAEKEGKTEKIGDGAWDEEDTITVTASSVEELLQKIQDAIYGEMSDHVMTDEERQVGSHIDFRG